MSKDHLPCDFARKSGYRSDLEIAETGKMVKSINTSFGSKNHNAYIHRVDGTHEHFFYSPKEAKSGWHGHNWETHNNHPQKQINNTKGGKTVDRNSFIESIKADKATINRCNEVSHKSSKNQVGREYGINDGGRERGDTGPASHGRESGYKGGAFSHHDNAGQLQGHSGQAPSGHGEGGHSTAGGHISGCGHGGHGSGGQGGH